MMDNNCNWTLLTEYLSCLKSNDLLGLDRISEQDKYEILRYCLKKGEIHEFIEICNLDHTIDIGFDNNLCFEVALYTGSKILIDCLLGKGMIINKEHKEKLFMIASDHIEILELIKKHGFNLHSNNEYIFRRATTTYIVDVFSYFIDEGVDITLLQSLFEEIIFNYAKYNFFRKRQKIEFIKILECMIKEGINISSNNELALKSFVSKGDYELTKIIINAGAQVSSLEPIHLQSLIKHRPVKLIELLLNHGINFAIINDSKYQSKTEALETFNLLERAGVNVDVIINSLTENNIDSSEINYKYIEYL